MIKLVLQCLFILFLSTATFLVGIKMNRTHIDLNRVEKSTGKPSLLKTIPNKNGRFNLTLQLQGDEHTFALYRFSQEYQPLIDKLSSDSLITIYYNPSNSVTMNYEIYQITASGGVIYSKDEFENREQLAGRYIAIPGSILLLILGWVDLRKRYKKLKP